MTLTLSILRCPEGVPPETRRLAGGELSIGRGPRNDWVLPDPDRVLSKQHCVVAFANNAWQVTDTSANGTFLNRDVGRLAAAEPRLLRNGDRLLLGSYEIEAAIEPDMQARAPTPPAQGAAQGAAQGGGPGAAGPGGRFTDDRLTSDPFPQQDDDPLGIAMPPTAIPPEFGRTTADNVAAVEGYFRPPRPSLELLPEDWDADLAAPARSAPAPSPASSEPSGFLQPPAASPPPASAAPLPPAFAPPPVFASPSAAPPSAAPPPAAPPPVASPPAASPLPTASPAAAPASPPSSVRAASYPAALSPASHDEAAAAAPAPPWPSPADPAGQPGAQQAFAAFAAGAGIAAPAPSDPLAVLHGLGRALRAVVGGLRRTMIARAAVKGEFRIDQTVIQESGNNPLKFSADDDDALAALLGTGRRSDMTAERAIGEAMRDIRLHELAVATAMQQAVRDMLAGLAPVQAERRAGSGALDRLPWRANARKWRAYEALHRETAQGMTDDFDRVFGTSFMRAYERAMSELSEQRGE